MHRRVVTLIVTMAMAMVGSATAQQPEAPKVSSRSNSKTENQKTVFAVKPGEKITFSVKAEGTEKYQWMVNKATQKEAENDSFTWTVPNKKGMWKICVKTTNKARQQWAKERAASCDKWLSAQKHGKKHPDEKEKFVRSIRDIHTWPVQSEKEWIVATSLTTVKPGESIQKAINSLPPEGGIVELAPGTHEVTEKMYPPGTSTFGFWGKVTWHYSIIIKRSNVVIAGTRDAIVRHHSKYMCFYILGSESPADNITFTGFTTASTRKRHGGHPNRVIVAHYAKNLTVANMHDKSWAMTFVSLGGHRKIRGKYGQNVTIKNNIMEHCGIGAAGVRNIRILNNTVLGSPHCNAIATDHCLEHVYIIGNRVINAGANAGILVDKPIHGIVSDNFVRNGQKPIRSNNSGTQTIIENNILTGGKHGGIYITCQPPMPECLIRNNLIYGNMDGIYTSSEFHARRPYTYIRLVNNIICNNRRDGIHTGAKEISMIVSNNIIANNKGYGINYKVKGPLTLSHNNLWNNGQGNYNGITAGPGDFSADPLFVNPSKHDYHLKSKTGRWDPKAKKWVKDKTHSPCIDAGDPKADYSKEPAPNGGRANIGAYGNTKEASNSQKKQEK